MPISTPLNSLGFFSNSKFKCSKTWLLGSKEINVILDLHNVLKASVKIDGITHEISNGNIEGIPQVFYKDPARLQQFLSECDVRISQFTDGGYKIYVSPRLKGGGNVVTRTSELWPKGIVPVYIDTNTFPEGSQQYNAILGAIDTWNKANTGIRFIQWDGRMRDYVAFTDASYTCSSNVGRQGGRQNVRCDLIDGGFNEGSILHELGHSIGLFHEHQRTDRDTFVNVDEKAEYGNYRATMGSPSGKYDLDSIMHYPESNFLRVKRMAFSSPLVGQPSSSGIGQRDHLSRGDIETVRALYRYSTGINLNGNTGGAAPLYEDKGGTAPPCACS